ncbi:hypothetical protein BG015_001523, partial [Linnemannia schmuckeri]
MPPSPFSSLPTELIAYIAKYLTRHDLARCVRVCDKWEILFNPFLWRHVHVSAAFRSYEGWTALVARIHHFRTLDLVDPLVAQLLSFILQEPGRGGGGLESLSASFEKEAPSLLTEEQMEERGYTEQQKEQSRSFGNAQMLMLMMQANKGLKSLTVDESCFRRRDGTDAFPYIMRICPTAHLERLEVRFNKNSTLPADVDPDSAAPDSTAPDIEELLQTLTEASESAEAGRSEYFHNMKELVISGGDRHIDFSRLAFIARCPNLERVQVENIDATAMLSLGFSLGYFCPQLSCLDWRGSPKMIGAKGDKSISDILSSMRVQWREMSLPNLQELGPLSFATLMKHVTSTLEVLNVEGWGTVLKEDFLDLVCSAQNLRRLEGPADGKMLVTMKDVVVSAVLGYSEHLEGKDRSWALGPSLEFLQLRIIDIPRPDIVCYRNGDPFTSLSDDLEGSRQLSQSIQQWVYTQLGRLTGLQELVLGVVDLDPEELANRGLEGFGLDSVAVEDALKDEFSTYGYQCLEFSLRSGLEMLEGLKELRMLDVKATAHRIGVAELDWMHVNWPKLKEIKGLVSAREWAGDAEAGLAVETAVE